MAKPHKVFGIGLNKTGTSSLRRALITLGYNHCDVRGQMTHKYFNNRFDQIFETVEKFDSFEDWPWPLMYQEVFSKYGDTARFFLTRRSTSADWLKSLKAHSLVTSPENNPRKRIYGFDYPHGAEEQHLAFYERHLKEVRAFFEKNSAFHLLQEICWEEGDGWAEVCEFLGEDVPHAPFPHVNRRVNEPKDKVKLSENQKRITAQIKMLSER